MEPLFHVIIPVYRAEAFLEDCVRSVLTQTWQNFRIILVDDASPDGSGALCDRLAAQDSRIHVIHQKNTGPFGARRAGIRSVLEQNLPDSWIMFLDSDDSYRPNTMETVVKTIRQEHCDLVIFGMDYVSGGKTVLPFDTGRAYLGSPEDRRQLYKAVFGDGWYNPLWRKAARAELFDREEHMDWYPIRFGEDLLQSICLYKNCKKATFIPDVIYNYTVNPDSATNTVRYENYRVNSTVLSAVWDFLQSENIWTEQDFTDYLCWCRTLTRIEVWTVAKFETSLKNRYDLLEQIRKDAYYSMVLSTAAQPDLVLVRKGIYCPLCLAGSCIKALGNLRRALRKMKGRKSS